MRLIHLFIPLVIIIISQASSYAQCTVNAAASDYDIICGTEVSLYAIGNGETVFEEDFNDGNLDEWVVDPTGTIETNICGSTTPDNTPYLWFGSSAQAPRDAITPCLDVSTGGVVKFLMRFAVQGGPNNCEGPDLETEGVHLQYRTNDAGCNPTSGWIQIDYWSPNGGNDPGRTNWNGYSANIPAGAVGANTQFRWVQLESSPPDALSGDQFDNWGIENVQINVNSPNAEYTWQHTGVSQPTGATPPVTPTSTTTYTVTYSDGTNTCTDDVTVNVTKAQVYASANPTEICPGDLVEFESISELRGELPETCGYTNDMACNPLTDEAGEWQVGNGNSVNTGGNCNDTPFGTANCDGGLSTQIIYRAAEVRAAGFNGGKITNIKFEIASVDGGYSRANNFKIWIACTNLNQFGNMIPQNQMTRVFNPRNITFAPGWQSFDFDQAFEWDGQTNIAVMICWNNPQGQGTRARSRDVTLNWNCIIQDGTNSAGGANFDCWDDTFFSTGQRRPNTIFSGCAPRDVDVDFSWNSTPNDPTLGNLNEQNPSANPPNSGTYTYTVTANGVGFPAGCAVTDQVNVQVQPAPATPQPSYNVGLCEGDALQLNFGPTALPPGATFEWDGPGGYTSTAQNPTRAAATPAMNGTYRVRVLSSAGCPSLYGTVDVTVNPQPPTPTLGQNGPLCDGEELQLTSNQPGFTYAWTGPNGWTSTVQNPTRNDPAPDMNGQYSLTLTNPTTGCSRINPTTINVTQNGLAPALPFTTPRLVLCPGEDLVLNTNVDGGFLAPDWDFTFGHFESAWTNQQTGNGAITTTRAGVTAAEAGTYYLVAQEDGSTCATDTAFLEITIFDPASIVASNGGPYCAGADIELEVTDAGGGSTYTWTGPNAYNANGRQVTRAGAGVADAGTYTVSVDNGICENPVVVTTDVIVTTSPDAGTDNSADRCAGDPGFDLFPILGGTPDPGGNWSDDDGSGNLAGSTFTPTTAGSFNFTYTIPASGTCPEVSAVVTINVFDAPVAGTGESIVVCQTDGTIDLFNHITGTYDAGGNWADLDASGQLAGSVFDPTGLAGNTYRFEYTVTGNAACPPATTIVTVEVQGPPNPGTPTDITLCETDGSIDLNDQLAGEDAGGTWTDDSGSGVLSGSTFNTAGLNSNDLPATYTFTYALNQNVCGTQSVSVDVTVNKAVEAGTGQTADICETNGAVSLFDFISGTYDTPGQFNDLDGAGIVGTTFNPAGLGGNTYRFEYEAYGNPPCANATTIITLTVVSPGDPGAATDLTLCSDAGSFDLFDQLAGQTSNGTWSDRDNTGALSGSTVDPSLINPNSIPGSFRFDHNITDLCGTHSETFTLTINQAPNAGDGTNITICASADPINLRNRLSTPFDNGGNWSDPDGSGGLVGSFFDPNGLGGGSFRIWYTVAGVAPCPDDRAEFVITVTDNPTAGAGTDLEICEGSGSINLFDQLSGNDPGGVWLDTDASGVLSGSTVNVNNINPNRIPGAFTYTYQIDDGCTVEEATVVITVNQAPNPGDDANVILCEAAGPTDLDPNRSSDSENGGNWVDPNATGKLTGSIFDPTGEAGNTFDIWYIVPGVSPCAAETALFQINVIDQADAGEDGSTIVCAGSDVDLFTQLGGTPDNGGDWTVASNNGVSGIDVSSGTFSVPNDGSIPVGTYVFDYTITAPAPCITVSSEVSVEVRNAPRITNLDTICTSDLTGYYITFTVVDGDGSSYTVSEPGSFAGDGVTYTTRTYPSDSVITVTVSDAWGCGTDSETVTKNCDCITRAATFNTADTLIICGENMTASGTELSNFLNDGDDVHTYYLHEGSGATLGNVITTSATNNFAFNTSIMDLGRVYYISAAAGNDNGSGQPDPNDPCYQFTAGTPVAWFRQPTMSSSIDQTVICPGEEVNFEIVFGDLSNPPYEFGYTLDGTTLVGTNDGSFGDTLFVENPLSTTTYAATYLVDSAGCRFDLNDSYNLAVNRSARADLAPGTACSDDTPLNLGISVSGDGDDWTVVYTNDLNGTQTTINNIPSSGAIEPVPFTDPNQAVTYTLVSVSDNSGSICPGVTTGSYTVNPSPTAEIVNSDATYCEGEAIRLRFNVTGIGPWDLNLQDDQGNTYTVNISNRADSVDLSTSLGAGNYTFTITSVTDLATGCTTAGGIGNPANIALNPGPRGQIGFNLNDPLDNAPQTQLTICEGSSATVDFQYISGSGNGFTVTYSVDGGAPQFLQLIPGTKSSITLNAVDLPAGTHTVSFDEMTDNTPASCATQNLGNAQITVKPLPVVTITNFPTDICEGLPVTVTYDVASTDPVTFDVFDASNNLITTVNGNPGTGQTFTFTPPSDGQFTYSISGLTESGVTPACANTHAGTYTLNVAPAPTGTMDSAPITVCQGEAVNLNYTTTGTPALDITISLRDENGVIQDMLTSNGEGQQGYQVTGLVPGVYRAYISNITDGSPSGCSASGIDTTLVTVQRNPSLNSASFSQNPVCFDEGTTFDIDIDGNGPFTVTFNDGLGNSYTENVPQNGVLNFPYTGTNSTTFTITNIVDNTITTTNGTGCVAANFPAGTDLTVNALPSFQINGNDQICDGETAVIGAQAGLTSGDFSVFMHDEVSGQNFTKSLALSGTQLSFNPNDYLGLDSLELVADSIIDLPTGCVGTVANNQVNGRAQILVKPIPSDQFAINALGGCAPFTPTAQFNPSTNYDNRVTNWTWTVNGDSIHNQNTLPLTLSNQGTVTRLGLHYESIHGCAFPGQNVDLTVFRDPVANFSFSPDKPTTIDNEVYITDLSENTASYNWAIAGDSSLVGESFYLELPNQVPGIYPACLFAVSPNGCLDTLCKTIEVKGVAVTYVPTAFTPDGDGVNEVFKPVLSEVTTEDYTFQIFNRWGELIFETSDPDQGWDGITKKGSKAPTGIYVYKISGVSAYTPTDLVNFTGNVNLLR